MHKAEYEFNRKLERMINKNNTNGPLFELISHNIDNVMKKNVNLTPEELIEKVRLMFFDDDDSYEENSILIILELICHKFMVSYETKTLKVLSKIYSFNKFIKLFYNNIKKI